MGTAGRACQLRHVAISSVAVLVFAMIASSSLLALRSDGYSTLGLLIGLAFLLPLYWAATVLFRNARALLEQRSSSD